MVASAKGLTIIEEKLEASSCHLRAKASGEVLSDLQGRKGGGDGGSLVLLA